MIEKAKKFSTIESQAKHFIEFFGDNSLRVISISRGSASYHPGQEELFKEVESLLEKKR